MIMMDIQLFVSEHWQCFLFLLTGQKDKICVSFDLPLEVLNNEIPYLGIEADAFKILWSNNGDGVPISTSCYALSMWEHSIRDCLKRLVCSSYRNLISFQLPRGEFFSPTRINHTRIMGKININVIPTHT